MTTTRKPTPAQRAAWAESKARLADNKLPTPLEGCIHHWEKPASWTEPIGATW